MKDARIRSLAPTEITAVQLWLKLMKAFHAIAGYLGPSLRASGLGDSDFRALEALLHKGPLPVNALGPKVYLTPGSISVAVDRLVAKKLVTRVNSLTDRRVRVVDLTNEGRSLIERVFAEHAHYLEQVAEVLSKEDRVCMSRALKKMGKHAEALSGSATFDNPNASA